jgi:preprotein translocase subunit YajC
MSADLVFEWKESKSFSKYSINLYNNNQILITGGMIGNEKTNTNDSLKFSLDEKGNMEFVQIQISDMQNIRHSH